MPPELAVISGAINSGKSRYLRALHDRVRAGGRSSGGIILEGVFSDSGHKSYRAWNVLDDVEIPLHPEPGRPSVITGRFEFDSGAFESMNDALIRSMDRDVVFFDEFGRLEAEERGLFPAFSALMTNYSGILIVCVRESILNRLLKTVRSRPFTIERSQ